MNHRQHYTPETQPSRLERIVSWVLLLAVVAGIGAMLAF